MKLSEVCIADLRSSAEQLNELLYGTDSPYVLFAEDPEKDRRAIERFVAGIPENVLSAAVPRAAGRVKFGETNPVLYSPFPSKDTVINMAKSYDQVPVFLQGSVFSTDAVRAAGIKFDERMEFLKEELFSIQFSVKNPEYYFLNGMVYESGRKSDELTSPPQAYQPGWYREMDGLWNSVTEISEEGKLSKQAQYALLYLTAQRFQSNRKADGKQIFDDGEEQQQYIAKMRERMGSLDEDVIAKSGGQINLTRGDMEYITGRHARKVSDIDMIHVKSLRYKENEKGEPYLEIFMYTRDSAEETFDIDVSEETGEKRTIKAELTPIMVDFITFFSNYAYELHAWHAIVPLKKKCRYKLAFILKDQDGNTKKCKMGFDGNWQSRLMRNSKGAYWAVGGNIIRCIGDRIIIDPSNALKHFKAEVQMLLYLAYKKYKLKNLPENVLKLRIHYWLTRPKYRNKRIWIYYDKLKATGDNAEYAWRYAEAQKDDGIEKHFYLNEGTRDYKRLSAAGYTMEKGGSTKGVMLALNAEAVFMTHSPPFRKPGINDRQMLYLKGLIHANIIRLYHGFAGTRHAYYSQIMDDAISVIVGSSWERDFYLQPDYGYTEDMIAPCGMPRYDDLVDKSKKQIMFAPTWTPALRDAGDDFKYTPYFKTYSRILADERLQETARRKGFTLAMFLHPTLAKHTKEFETNDVVKAYSSLKDKDYVTMMTESDLMVTDYSSVHFDFAYMRKPVVYYQDPTLTPWREHSFSYENMGFGEVVCNPEELIDTLCAYIENDCKMSAEYKDRANSFFLQEDRFSAKRVYEDTRRRLG